MAIEKNDLCPCYSSHRHDSTEFAHRELTKRLQVLPAKLGGVLFTYAGGIILNLCRLLDCLGEAAANAGTDSRDTDHGFRVSDREVARLTRAQHHFDLGCCDSFGCDRYWTTWGRYQTPHSPRTAFGHRCCCAAPLMGMASVLAAMRLSAKMTDPQSANQFTGLVIVPTFMSHRIFGNY